MKIEKGMILRIATKPQDDVFGDCMYEVAEVGIKPPETGREAEMDGVKCVMLGGAGPSAHAGRVIIDSEMSINRNIKEGITNIVEASSRAGILAAYEDRAKDGTPRSVKHGAAGCMEME